MCALAIVEPARLSTKEAAEEWNDTRRNVASWCKDGYIQGARKDLRGNTAWSIPADAKRPIDSKLIRELLWQIVEKSNGIIDQLDLTDWGIPIGDTEDYVQALIDNHYLERAVMTSNVRLLKKAIRSLGRHLDGDVRQPPETLILTASAAGTFAGSLARSILDPKA